MKIIIFLLMISIFLTFCRNNSSDDTTEKYKIRKLRNQVHKTTVNFIKAQLHDTKKKVLENGAVVYSGSEIEYLADTSFIVTGDINGDNISDAIMSIFIFKELNLIKKEHLILIRNEKGKLIVDKILDGEMRFLSIDNGIISIETSKIDPDSPFYGCNECKEVYPYRFIDGDLRKIK